MTFKKILLSIILLTFINISYGAFRAVTPIEIASNSPINLKATGATSIGRNLDNSKFIFISKITIYVNNASGVITPPTISIGTNASNYNNILSATLLTASPTGEYTLKFPTGSIAPVANNSEIFVNVTIGAIATTYSARISVEGTPTPS